MKIKIIITSTDSKEVAYFISNKLIDENLAACVKVINNVSSTYKWKNKTCNETEFLLIIKTSVNNLKNCIKNIEELHNYDIPELITLDTNIINKKYEHWFLNNLLK